MRILKWIGAAILSLLLLAIIAIRIGLWVTRPELAPPDSASAARLDAGPYAVTETAFTWVDESRPTSENGEYEGAPTRTLDGLIWSPAAYDGSAPLLIYSHGFRSNREEGVYLARYMASHGYVVVAADFPLSNGSAPGEPTILDIKNQPGDVSFLIDQTLALSGAEKPFRVAIDPERIGAVGLSLGGLTTTLAAFHPELRDPRLAAALSMAGPVGVFGPAFYAEPDMPYLSISGTEDAIVPHETNAVPIPARIQQGGLLELEGGTHAGFAGITAGVIRLLGNPDAFLCSLVGFGDEQDPFYPIFEGTEGARPLTTYIAPCSQPFGEAMAAGRQQAITKLAVRAFFDSHFSMDAAEREASAEFLTQTLPQEWPEVSYIPSTESQRSE